MTYIAQVILVVFYNLTILGATVYLVQFYDWNPWWFLLAVCLLANTSKDTNEKDN